MSDPRVTDDTRPLRPPVAEMRGGRDHAWAMWLVLAVVVGLPILEVVVLIGSGRALGFLPTVLLMLATTALGGWLLKREGSRAWGALSDAARTGRMPSRELADGSMVLLGGILLLFPGFLTDVLGLLFLLPFTRPLMRGVMRYAFQRSTPGVIATRPRPSAGDATVVPGEVVDDVVSGTVEDQQGRVLVPHELR